MSLKSATKIETNVHELKISIDADSFKAAIVKVYQKQKSSISIPGFRKGKVPMNMVEKIYGKGVFYEDALELLYPDAVEEAIKESALEIVAAPHDVSVDEIGENGVEITLKVTVKPEVEVPAYKGLEAEKSAVEVTDDEIDAELASRREQNSRLITIEDRAVADGDIANIDFEGFVDDVAFEGGKGESYDLTIGSGQFIPGFEEQIVGHAIGDEFDVNVTFPEEYTPELASKAAVFKVKVNSVKMKELPELDDEFAKDLGFDTVDELKANIKEETAKAKQQQSDDSFEDALREQLVHSLVGEIPQVMIDERAEDNKKNFADRLQSQGIDIDTYLMYMGMEKDAFEARLKEDAEHQVKARLALEKIVELENIEATDEDVDGEIAKIAEMYGVDIETVKRVAPVDGLKKDIAVNKAMKFVVENAKASKPAAKKKASVKKKAAEGEEDETPTEKKKAAPKKKPADAE